MVCAPPECIKSLLLKFIEQLHSLEGADLYDVARIGETVGARVAGNNGNIDMRDAAELRMAVEKLQVTDIYHMSYGHIYEGPTIDSI